MWIHQLNYQQQDALKVAAVIAILFLVGGLHLLNQHHYDPEKWRNETYSHERLFRAAGLYLWGLALALVPSLIAVLTNRMWLHILTVVVFLLVTAALTIVERKGLLRPTDKD